MKPGLANDVPVLSGNAELARRCLPRILALPGSLVSQKNVFSGVLTQDPSKSYKYEVCEKATKCVNSTITVTKEKGKK